jgi:hypothetical protein
VKIENLAYHIPVEEAAVEAAHRNLAGEEEAVVVHRAHRSLGVVVVVEEEHRHHRCPFLDPSLYANDDDRACCRDSRGSLYPASILACRPRSSQSDM